MPPRHAKSSIDPASATTSASCVIAPGEASGTLQSARGIESCESCDYCGSARLEWRKCKLVCADCRQINKSCADL
jgi:hypothetical protein